MTSSFDAQGLQYAWNSSSIKLVEECLRKYYYVMIEGWTSPNRNFHLRFGGHFATALEHYYKHRANGMESEDALCEVVHEALCATWDRRMPEDYENHPDGSQTPHPIIGQGSPWESGDTAKNRENLIRTIVWYVAEFEADPITVHHLSDGKPAVELSVVLPVDNDIVFAAHLDRVVDYSGEPYVMDQKTTGSALSSYYFNQYSPDTQMSMYTFLGKAAFSIPVKGVIIDAAQIMVGFTRFARGFTFRTDDQLEEWYDNSMYHIEAARTATREKHFPMNTTSCGNYGGCPFRDVCSRPKGVRENFLRASFEKGKVLQPLEQR